MVNNTEEKISRCKPMIPEGTQRTLEEDDTKQQARRQREQRKYFSGRPVSRLRSFAN